MLGYVTSPTYSITLKKYIALALLKNGNERMGTTLYAANPLGNSNVKVEVVSPQFYDPEGKRSMSDRLRLAPVYRPLHGTTSPGHAAMTCRSVADFHAPAGLLPGRSTLCRVVRDFFNLQLTELNRAQIAGDTSLLWQGPNRWLLVAPDQRQGDLTEALIRFAVRIRQSESPTLATPAASFACRDHRSEASWPGVHAGSGVAGAAQGPCVMTGFSHYAVTLHMVEEEVIDLYITRSLPKPLGRADRPGCGIRPAGGRGDFVR